MQKLHKLVRNRWAILAGGVILGALIILTVRFVTYSPVQVHYHANFALYINGKREQFKDPKYYQEVAVCSATEDITAPEQRAHMHENKNSEVHVHDHAATWGQFFENLGWYVGPDFIQTDTGTIYKAGDTDKLHILINGQDYTDLQPITNTVIKDDARLLVSYGNDAESQLQKQYKTIPATAEHLDHAQDPASCAGSHKITFKDRLKHLF